MEAKLETTWSAIERRMQVAVRWWNGESTRTKVAIGAATLFALASMLNLASTAIVRTSRPPAPAAATAVPTVVPNLLAEAAPADAGKTWSVRGLWQGTGSKETDAFVVGDHWRVDWLFNPESTGGSLQIFIYHADGRLLMSIATNTQSAGADTSFWSGAGKYFLKINSSRGDWRVDVQDLR